MSKTTTLLLVATLFVAVTVHSVNSAAADVFSFTNGSFYKEKAAEKLLSTGDASLADAANGQKLIAGPNSKSYYYVYQLNTATDKDDSTKGGSTILNVRKVDVNKLAFAEKFSAVTVTGFKWRSTSTSFQYGASVKNNITALAVLSVDPSAENIVRNLYAYLIDLDKNEKTELLIASGSYSETTTTTISIEGVHISSALTVILYSATTTTSSGSSKVFNLVTLKNGKLGETVTAVKTITWTGVSAAENFREMDGTGENVYIVFSSVANSLSTETVYVYTVTEKETKTGTTAVINTNVADTNKYSFSQIHGHAEGRWVALYSNQSITDGVTTTNYVARASNDTTTFKVLITDVSDKTGATTKTYSFGKYFGGVIAYITDGSTSSGGESIDQYTYNYQTFGGDFTPGTKTAYVTASGKYAGSNIRRERLGDNKAINVIATQVAQDATDPEKSTVEGVYFGQLFQKSFGATLQSVLAVCSLMLAALFFF